MMSVRTDWFDKYIALFKREGARICVEIYRCNLDGKPINYGRLYDKYRTVVTEGQLSNILATMANHKMIDEKWQLEKGVWVKNIFIKDKFIPELQEINTLFETEC